MDQPSGTPAKFAWLNQPFAVTVIGGLLLAMVSHSYEAARARGERDAAAARARRDAQYQLLTDFCNGFVLQAKLTASARVRELEKTGVIEQPPHRTAEQSETQYREYMRRIEEGDSPWTLVARGRALFSSREAERGFDELLKWYLSCSEQSKVEQVQQWLNRGITEVLGRTTAAMGDEIRRTDGTL